MFLFPGLELTLSVLAGVYASCPDFATCVLSSFSCLVGYVFPDVSNLCPIALIVTLNTDGDFCSSPVPSFDLGVF